MAESSYGFVRGGSAANYGEASTSQIALNSRGDQLVAQSLPGRTELVALQHSWNVAIPTGSAFTNVATMPTTRSELALYNGEPGDGYSYVIDSVWYMCLTSITAASGISIIYQVDAVTALAENLAVLISSPTGRASYDGNATKAVATTTMTANKWTSIASAEGAGAVVSIGTGLVAHVDGGIIVPPGFTIGVNAVLGTAVGTSIMGITWHEVKLAQG